MSRARRLRFAIIFLLCQYFFVVDVLTSAMCTAFHASVSVYLQSLANSVEDTVISSNADGTVRSYLEGFKRWKIEMGLVQQFLPLTREPFPVPTLPAVSS